MKTIRSLACALTLSLAMTAQATTWENLGFRFITELMRDHINIASKEAIGQDKVKIGSLTLTETGDLAEYLLVAYSKSGKDRTHEELARLATNSFWHILSPILKQIIQDKSSFDKTELILRSIAKYIIYGLIDPYIPS